VEYLDVEREVTYNGESGKIKMSSAFFMQPRVKFRLERFLIFKNRTMTVGDVVRTHELGNWMRQNSPDEFLQFFNIALGDMGGLGIRTMPEHEVLETKETQWLYCALMNFVPGGMTSPGSIVMRKMNYGLSKAEQLFQEIRFYDPRFKNSSSFITDIAIMLRSILVLNKGRVGKALQDTESFEGENRGF
jgi:lipopolysaccharide/colanic/teichoic acid biosynthesis glycosyltransferase